jgi:hypothetical protein
MTDIKSADQKTQVFVPGTLMATIEHGRIVNYTFTPAAADAGYFGDAITVWDGEDITSEEFFDLVSTSLTFSYNSQSAFFACEWQS